MQINLADYFIYFIPNYNINIILDLQFYKNIIYIWIYKTFSLSSLLLDFKQTKNG